MYREEDADLVNEEWLLAAKESFEDAVLADDFETARMVIADLKDKGFENEAKVLERELDKKNG